MQLLDSSANEYRDLLVHSPSCTKEATKASEIEFIQFACGVSINTLGTGTPKAETEALGGLRPWPFVINMSCDEEVGP